MNIRNRALVAGFVLGCGLFAPIAPASATIITDLLRVNFNNITVPDGGEVLVSDVLGLLPAGTTIIGAPNVRGANNEINTTASPLGFEGHFTSNFLVLGDESGAIGPQNGTPTTGNTGIKFQFVVPTDALRIRISYRDYFNGVDNSNPQFDEFLVRVDGAGPPVAIEILQTFHDFDFGGHTGVAGEFKVVDFDDADPFTIRPGTYELQFGLSESGGQTNTAVGLDRIRVRAEVVPEPGSLLLLASGLAGLAGWGRRRIR